MTNLIDTTKRKTAELDTALKPPTASEIQPEVVVEGPGAGLESRIDARRAQLSAKLAELKASGQLDAAEAGDRIKARLAELSHIVKEGVVDGWANLGDTAKRKLDRWLAVSAKELTFKPESGQS